MFGKSRIPESGLGWNRQAIPQVRLRVVVESLMQTNYRILSDGSSVAVISDDCLEAEQGAVEFEGTLYDIRRRGWWRKEYFLAGDDACAIARQTGSFFRTEFTLEFERSRYTLNDRSFFNNNLLLRQNGHVLGYMENTGIFLSETIAVLPIDIPVPVQVFIIWLGLVSWDLGGSDGGGGA